MFTSQALLSFIFTGLAVVHASPLDRRTGKASLDFSRRINTDGMLNIVEKDRARAQALRRAGHLNKRDGAVNLDVTNGGIAYYTSVGVNNSAMDYTLGISIISGDTWIDVDDICSSQDTVDCTVNLTLAPDLVVADQTIMVGPNGGFNLSNFLGLGPRTSTASGTTNTVMDNLYAQGTIPEEVLGIYLVPTSESSNSGTLTFGGYDDSFITSAVKYAPITTAFPSSNFWGIDQSISYGGETILQTVGGIVDIGFNTIFIATDAFQRYQSATGGAVDPTTGLLTITPEQYANLKTLSFNIGGISYDLSPNAQIWPRSLNADIGGKPDSIYLVVSDIGSPSGVGLDVINGFPFLQRYYSVLDTNNKRVGFAPTAYTNSISN